MHVCLAMCPFCVAQMLVCPHICLFKPPPPCVVLQSFHFYIQPLFFVFELFVAIVSVECLFVVSPVSARVSLQGLVGECDEGIGRD